jgi:hypothetical protein
MRVERDRLRLCRILLSSSNVVGLLGPGLPPGVPDFCLVLPP